MRSGWLLTASAAALHELAHGGPPPAPPPRPAPARAPVFLWVIPLIGWAGIVAIILTLIVVLA